VKEVLQFAVLGLGTGAILVLLSQGIIVVYRGAGIINFATGAIAMMGAYLYIEFHDRMGMPVGVAIAGGVVACALIGVVVHLGIMRPLRRASALTRTVATLGVLIVLQGFAQVVWGLPLLFTTPYLPQSTTEAFGLVIGVDRLWLLAIACVVTAAMWSISRFTRFGLATTGVAESERTAASVGWSPDKIASANWAIGGALAGLAGALVVPITGVQFAQMSLLVVPALAVCLLGGFASFPITLLAGILLGIAQSEVARYSTTQGASNSIPFIIIVIVLMVRGRALPLRSHLLEKFPQLGTGRIRIVTAVALIAAASAVISLVNDEYAASIIQTLCWAVIMLSVVVLTGYSGQLSLAQMAFAGIGAFTAAKLVAEHGWPFELALVAGIVAAILIGVVFSFPALRTRGVNLAVITLGLGLALYLMVLTNITYTGRGSGLRVGDTTFLGIDISAINHPQRYALFALVGLLVAMFVVANLRRSRGGRSLIAVRTNERAAASLGVNVLTAKIYAFSVSAGIAGLGGILLTFKSQTAGFMNFDVFSSIQVVAFTVIGGIGFIAGSLFGTVFVIGGLVQQIIQDLIGSLTDSLADYLVPLAGLGLLSVLLQNPDGLAADAVHRSHKRGEKRATRRAAKALQPGETPQVSRRATAIALDAPGEHPTMPSKTVGIRDVTVRFGNVEAVSHVDLEITSGRIVGLIGPNGAGKTTLVDAVTGYVNLATGGIELDGKPISRWKPYRRARAGITRSFQSLELFEDLSVLDNLRAAADRRDAGGYLKSLVWPDDNRSPEQLASIAHDFGLVDDLDRKPSELPYGRRRLVAIARAVATSPSILLLDEPAAGLSGAEIADLAVLVRTLARDWNVGMLLIEHDVEFVMGLCDEVAVLDFGRMIAQGTPDQVRADAAVRAAYLGEEIESTPTSPSQ
jgi:sulfate-transporting ATPase